MAGRAGTATTGGRGRAGTTSSQAGTATAGGGDDRAAELLAAISAVRRTARRAVRQRWHAEPLPMAQGELLRLVAAQPGISVAEAAGELRLAPNTVSTLVGRLVTDGLLARGRVVADGRAVRLSVTAKARQRLASYRDLRAEITRAPWPGWHPPTSRPWPARHRYCSGWPRNWGGHDAEPAPAGERSRSPATALPAQGTRLPCCAPGSATASASTSRWTR